MAKAVNGTDSGVALDARHFASRVSPVYRNYGAWRFGQVSPFYWDEDLPRTKHKLRCGHLLQSYTLAAPVMQDIMHAKRFFFASWQSLLPYNHDLARVEPAFGQSIDRDVQPVMHLWMLLSFWQQKRLRCVNYVGGSSALPYTLQNDATTANLLSELMRMFAFTQIAFGKGSLFESFGIHLSKYVVFANTSGRRNNADDWCANLLDYYFGSAVLPAFDVVFYNPHNNEQGDAAYQDPNSSANFKRYTVCSNQSWLSSAIESGAWTLAYPVITLRDFLYRAMESPHFSIVPGTTPFTATRSFKDEWSIVQLYDNFNFQSVVGSNFSMPDQKNLEVSIAPILAYQLACAEYYSDDHVDNINSADTWRKLVRYYWQQWAFRLGSSGASIYFDFNGVRREHDIYSWGMLIQMADYLYLNCVGGNPLSDQDMSDIGEVLHNLLCYRRSLRFKDLASGCRLYPYSRSLMQPNEVSVNSNKVAVVDITRGIQMQRLLNSLNRAGNSTIAALEQMFPGSRVPEDPRIPNWLFTDKSKVVSVEREATGSELLTDKNSKRANFESSGGRFEFEFTAPVYGGILIGVCDFDLARVYYRGCDWLATHTSKWDFGNPFLQFIGDQKMMRYVLDYSLPQPTAGFGYTSRYQEYRSRLGNAFGPLAGGSLKGWLAAYGDSPVTLPAYTPNIMHKNLNSDFVRSHPQDIDKFYLSLNGLCLCDYFHFFGNYVVKDDKVIPLSSNPKIL